MRYGFRFKNYTLLERIGEGGEADIWSGWDSKTDRVIALRIIPKPVIEPGIETNISSDVQRQVELLSQIDHPNVLPHYEFGTEEYFHYIAMRYCPMGSLADRILAGPISLVDVLKFAAQITSALEYLHSRKIVHRDLNPSNLLIDGQERVYLADFGLAKLFIQDTLPMHTGRGTEIYAPFEQFARYEVVPQSDIYSLGITLFEMLTGKLPWSDTGIFATKPEEESLSLPDLNKYDSTLPAALTDTLRHLTAYYWDQRPSSASEAFELLLDASGISDNGDLTSYASLPKLDGKALVKADARYLLEKFLSMFDADTGRFPARLTDYSVIDSAYLSSDTAPDGNQAKASNFMLHGAIVHNYHLDEWWQRLSARQDRIQVCAQILINEDEGTAGRALTQLLSDPGDINLPAALRPAVLERLVDLASDSMSWSLRQKALQALPRMIPKATVWQSIGITTQADLKIANLALAEVSISAEAAHLIGWVRSESAVNLLLETRSEYEPGVVIEILGAVRSSAGSLPDSVPIGTRLQVESQSARTRWLQGQRELSLKYILIGLSAGLLVTLLMLLGVFSQYDTRMRDSMFEPYPVSNVITIVEVADEDLEKYGRWERWPRSLHTQLVNRLSMAGARTILLDFVFEAETDDDLELAEAIRNAGNVVQPVLGLNDALTPPGGREFPRYTEHLTPNPLLLAASVAVGHTNIVLDDDGYVRKAPTIIQVNEDSFLSLAMAAIQVFLEMDEPPMWDTEQRTLDFAGRQIPVDDWGSMILHYAGPPAGQETQTFRMVNYLSVLDDTAPEDLFRDKIVLVGLTATGGKDIYPTPVSQGRLMAGVEILANYIETIWSSRFISRPRDGIRIVILLLLGALIGLFSRHLWSGLLLTVLFSALYFLLASWIFDYAGVMLDLLYPFLVMILSFFMVTVFRLANR